MEITAKNPKKIIDVITMMANKMNVAKKTLLVGTLIYTFGMPLTGKAQEKLDSVNKSDTGMDSIQLKIDDVKEGRDETKEKLRLQIGEMDKQKQRREREIDSIEKQKQSAISFGEKNGYSEKEIAPDDWNETISMRIKLAAVSLIFLVFGIHAYRWYKRHFLD